MVHILAIGMPGLPEWIIIAALGLLMFGKRLPEVGRSLGKGIVEFKKGLRGIDEEIDDAVDHSLQRKAITDQHPEDFKFDPQTGEPIERKARFDPYTGKPLETDARAPDPSAPQG